MVKVAVNRRYVEIHLQEPITCDLILSYQADANKLASGHGLAAFLYDVSGFPSAMGALDSITAAEKIWHSGLPDSSRIAILASSDDTSHSFFETAAQNRGLAVRCFTAKSRALDWLLS